MCVFSHIDGKEHIILTYGEITQSDELLVRIHSECITSEVFGSLKCDCAEQLQKAIKLIAENGSGMILYLRQEGRGIGLGEKLKAYKLQEKGFDTIHANLILGHPIDAREYSIAISMLQYFEITRVRLLTNNPNKINALEKAGILVRSHPMPTVKNRFNQAYLAIKALKMGHETI